MARKHLHIAVFLPAPSGAQLLDTACVDVLAMMSHQYMSALPHLPSHVAPLAPDMTISYVGAQKKEKKREEEEEGHHSAAAAPALVQLTAGLRVAQTHHYLDPAVAPGKLDAVLVPGPDPSDSFPADALDWLRRQAEAPGTDILSICTGIYICGAAGLLDGHGRGAGRGGRRRACGPRGLQAELREKYPSCELVGHELRWTRDGNFWSSGGVTNGNDLVAAYCRESGRFPSAVVEIACKIADVGDRPQKMGESQGVYFLGVAWQLVKAWFTSVEKGKGTKDA